MNNQTQLLLLTLCGDFGDGALPLGVKEYRKLKVLMSCNIFFENNREVSAENLLALGFDIAETQRIMTLISREKTVESQLDQLSDMGIVPITCISPDYPKNIAEKLGESAPAVLFCAGNTDLLKNRAAAIVGSRTLAVKGAEFAAAFGRACAQKGITLVSGGAEGADMIAQQSALSCGGAVISFRPDSLIKNRIKLSSEIDGGKLLIVSERGADCSFSAASAASRNRLIHSYCSKVFVAGADYKSGGTWSGTEINLKKGYSKVYVLNDGSRGCSGLIELGAEPVETGDIISLL